MNARNYRLVRIVVGGLVLIACALAFADIGNWLGVGHTRAILWPQFAPSLSALLTGGGWLATGCIAVILLTLVFGRVYCAMLCPLGVLMDFSAWLAKRTGKKRKLPYRPGRPWLPSSMVAVCVIGLIAGTAVPLAFLDPYSIFGKITGGTLRPALGTANELLASTAWINPVKVSPVAWVTTGVALGLLLMVVITAVYRGHLKAGWPGPPAQGLPAQATTTRTTEVVCGLRSGPPTASPARGCGQDARATWPGPPAQGPRLNRRDVLTAIALLPTAALAGQQPEHAPHRNRRAVLPPGAGSLARFQNLCTACQLCVTNCPDQVLRPSITKHGLAGFLQPYQDFDVSFCSYNCSNCS